MNICDNTFILSILRIIKIIINALQYIVPLILIVIIMVDVFKFVTDPNEKNKLLEKNLKKIIAAILIFFVPVIVKTVFITFLNESAIFTCFKNANDEYIQVKIKENKEQAKKDEEEATKRYEEQQKEIDSRSESETEKEVEDISTGKFLGLDSSFKSYNDNKVEYLSGYYLYIPENATENMPLIVFFPANNLSGKIIKSYFELKDVRKIRAFIYIPLIPNNGERVNWSKRHCTSAVKKINELVDTYKINKNKISLMAASSSGWYIYWTANTYRIFSSIVPISSGMNIDTIKTYDGWEYLKTIPMRGYGEEGGKFAGGHSCEKVGYVTWSARKNMSQVFEELGKKDNFIFVPDVCHGEIGNYVFELDDNNNNISDIIEWMIAQ